MRGLSMGELTARDEELIRASVIFLIQKMWQHSYVKIEENRYW